MAFLEIANTVGAPSDPRPKVLHVYLAAIGLDVLPGYAEDTTESTAAEPLVSGCRPISRRAAHLGRASERDFMAHEPASRREPKRLPDPPMCSLT
jgi:hypothetical protein